MKEAKKVKYQYYVLPVPPSETKMPIFFLSLEDTSNHIYTLWLKARTQNEHNVNFKLRILYQEGQGRILYRHN